MRWTSQFSPWRRVAWTAAALSAGVLLSGCVVMDGNSLGGCRNDYTFGSGGWGGGNIMPGQTWRLCNGYAVEFQRDGNLVSYSPTRQPLWNSGTANRGATRMLLQEDGNLVIYAGNAPLWASGTNGQYGARLSIQGNGRLLILGPSGNAVWGAGGQ